MIQRFGIKAASGFSKLENTFGAFVTFDDAETDKAEAVAAAVEKATTAMRAELVELYSEQPLSLSASWINGWLYVVDGTIYHRACRRLVELGAWEREQMTSSRWRYRPIEPQDSGETDET